jgi:hypothetical protein
MVHIKLKTAKQIGEDSAERTGNNRQGDQMKNAKNVARQKPQPKLGISRAKAQRAQRN